ncbi:6-pyruvoyl trahydropterin synthase family protein [Desulfolutivibrio sulfoxidireducens]|uniref:6-pyruvoyl trahydropterin synthase family protein n=1 Tax=Desulfolutivibrio sulfoxidireducens TaxID=2773299 RepID=UPI00159E9908|nr:6-carboxytetrahydropterin synthase [Desulfolutivibrio sulfoxidireducens]QLA16767.1 6-carboxytetrahydropterin synthase QueD [Desulfolutivibrio sulfoxidireducens]QLA20331.1 6-carboxytetrahydropterin synthase QueD [Desulfolutivibrio sulfoxidireducens]
MDAKGREKGGQGAYLLTVTGEFAAAHCLRHYGGPCENLHGHNFAVEAVVRGEKLEPKVDILMDFKELKSRLGAVTAELDHCHLNELPAFDKRNPSSEMLARYIFEGLKTRLADVPRVTLVSVSVSEKASSKATYMEI